MSRYIGVLALGAFALVALAGGNANAANKCAGSKIKAAGKKASCLLGLESKEAKKGLVKDPLKVAKCKNKFSTGFAKAEAKGGCLVNGDFTAIENKVDAFVDDEDDALAPGSNDPPAISKCTSSKLKATGKKAKCKLGLEAKEAAKDVVPDPLKVQKCEDKFSASFAKAELAADCIAATGDTNAIEGDVDAFVADVDTESTPTTVTTTTNTTVTTAGPTTTTTTLAGCNCCSSPFTQLSFTTGVPSATVTGNMKDAAGAPAAGSAICTGCPNLTAGGLYIGGAGVGLGVPLQVPDMGQSFTGFASCNASTGAYTIAPRTAGQTGSNRNCTSSSGANPEYPTRPGCLFGPPLPIPNNLTPSTSTCVVNRVATDASGAGNCTDGSISSLSLPLTSDTYLTGDLSALAGVQPCPVCVTRPIVGTCTTGTCCDGGPNDNEDCSPGSGAIGAAYPTSHDCPPPDNDQPIGGGTGKFIGSLPIPFNLTTGTSSKVSIDTPTVGTDRLFCGFCATPIGVTFQGPPAVPCTSNAGCTSVGFTSCKQRNSGAFGTGDVRTITETGSPAGVCLDDGAPHAARLASVFCIPPAFNPTVDSVGDLPSPGAVTLPGVAEAQ